MQIMREAQQHAVAVAAHIKQFQITGRRHQMTVRKSAFFPGLHQQTLLQVCGSVHQPVFFGILIALEIVKHLLAIDTLFGNHHIGTDRLLHALRNLSDGFITDTGRMNDRKQALGERVGNRYPGILSENMMHCFQIDQ